jgi:hypothetical protein
MNDFLGKLGSHDATGLLIVGASLAFSLVLIIGSFAYKIVKSNNQTRLKQEMLARGMSAEEIKTVLDAGGKDCGR